ncbi:MAG: integrin alpha [Nanoarchaeota archaeon]|nr:integrin alpha [Nanoarchaeota archaeon]
MLTVAISISPVSDNAAGELARAGVVQAGAVQSPKHFLAVGSPSFNAAGDYEGKAYAFDKGSGRLMRSWLGVSVHGTYGVRPERLGLSVAVVGDIDKDGYDDILAGAAAPEIYGRAYLYSGRTGRVIFSFEDDPGQPSDYFGSAVAWAGDVNKDGWDDLAIGASEHLDPVKGTVGKAYIYSGRDGSEIRSYLGEQPFDFFGWAVANAGDVNQDGWPDLIVGARCWDPVGEFWACDGKVYVYSGKDGQLLYEWTDGAGGFGGAVSGLGDVNDDGVDDVIYGGNGADGGRGIVYVRSGQDGSVLYSISGAADYEAFGQAVSGVGDVDLDGSADFLVTGPQYEVPGGASDIGRAVLYSGRDGSVIHSWTGEEQADELGHAVSGAGDVDGDGVPDVLVGIRDQLTGGCRECTFNGWAYVFSGATGQKLYEWEGEHDQSLFGTAVSGKWW